MIFAGIIIDDYNYFNNLEIVVGIRKNVYGNWKYLKFSTDISENSTYKNLVFQASCARDLGFDGALTAVESSKIDDNTLRLTKGNQITNMPYNDKKRLR